MTVERRELYSSSNGDRWHLARDVALGQVFIWHEPNSSWLQADTHRCGVFLGRDTHTPERQELLRVDRNLGRA